MALEQLIQKLQRDVNCLSDDNRTARRRALEHLRKEITLYSPAHSTEVMEGLMDFLLKPLLREFSDPVEKCRELAIGIISELSSSVQDYITTFVPVLMPVMVSRLGTESITEPSEELRLSLICLLRSILQSYSASMGPYVNDMMLILQQTIVDPYPEVKKESCQCVIFLAPAIPAVFYQQSGSLVKPLLQSVGHQHSKVRLASVKALGSTIHYGPATAIDDALPFLAQRVSDPIPSVRSSLVDVLADWLSNQPDRYSYHHKLIPLLLICTCDEVPEISHKAHQLWDRTGLKYEGENEEDLKDQLNFMQLVEAMPGLPFERPRLGCRVLVSRNFSKILPAILKDITDWTVNSRVKASQLLYTLLYHLEEHATHHIQAIVNGLYRACQDEESSVVDQAIKCSEVIGYYVSVEVWISLVVPAVRTSAGCRMASTQQASTVPVGPVQCTSCLMVLAGCIKGAKNNDLQPYLQVIAESLSEPEVSLSDHLPLLRQLLQCISVTISAAGQNSRLHSSKFFSVLLRVAAVKHWEDVKKQVDDILEQLARAQGMQNVQDLYCAHAQDITHKIKMNYKGWTIDTPDCALFSSLLSGAGPVVGQILDDVIPLLVQCLQPEGDPEMRLHFITLLIHLLVDAQSTVNSQHQFSPFVGRVLSEIIVPNTTWRGGRTAAAIRTASMTCLQALLQGKLFTSEQLGQSIEDLIPKVTSCLDDTNQSTRLVSCKVLQLLLNEKQHWTVNMLHPLYSDLLKRLDDSSDEIRIAVTKTLTAYVGAFPENYERDLFKAHTEALFKGLLIHLDDASPEIQNAMLQVLKDASRLNPNVLLKQLEEIKHKHRTDRYCEELLEFLKFHHHDTTLVD